MPKRKLEDDLEDDWVDAKIIRNEEPDIKKHSLDSDEEDEYETKKELYDIMGDDDIEGQEEGVGGREGEVQITPFNMKEELEEGHFDTEGNFHWKKEKVIRDSWLENIDWMKIKDSDLVNKNKGDFDESMDSSTVSPFDILSAYKSMIELMDPGESVAKALQRLGGNKSLSASERLKRKKAGLSIEDSGNSEKVTELTELANTLLTRTGNMDIYQHTYQQISNMISSMSNKAGPSSSKYEDVLDMYADDFDQKEKARLEQSGSGGMEPTNAPTTIIQNEESENGGDLMWEYKWAKDAGEVQGPHSTQQMQKYVDEGFFKNEVWVRKVGQDGPFYSSRRVDFELYL